MIATQIRGGIAPLFCLVCLLHFGSITQGKTPMAFAAERKLLVEQSLMSTIPKSGPRTPSPPPRPPPRPIPLPPPTPPPPPPPPPPEDNTWCVVKPSTPQEKLDDIIDYCCTQDGVNCSVIQPGGMCYFPPNKVSDASVVMNIFYKLNGGNSFDCYFKESGLIVTQNPSVGKCIYPS